MFGFITPPDTIPEEETQFIQNGIYASDHMKFVYGTLESKDIYETDAVLFIYDDSGGLKKTIIFEDNESESFVYMSSFGSNKYVLACEKYETSDTDSTKHYLETVIIEYNSDFEIISQVSIPDFITGYMEINQLLLVKTDKEKTIFLNEDLTEAKDIGIEAAYLGYFSCQFEGTALINGVSYQTIDITSPGIYDIDIIELEEVYSFTVMVDADVYLDGMIQDNEFIEEVKVYSLGDLYINDEPYSAGDTLDKPGNYTIKVLGTNGYLKTVDFCISPSVMFYDYNESIPMELEQSISKPIIVYSNGNSMTLNGDPYASRIIDNPGNYILEISGINGYTKHLNFHINPAISGLENNGEYQSVEITIFGEAKLNGENVTGVFVVDNLGDYNLKLFFEGNVFQEYNFKIIGDAYDANEIKPKTDNYLKYSFFALIGFGVYFILRKK